MPRVVTLRLGLSLRSPQVPPIRRDGQRPSRGSPPSTPAPPRPATSIYTESSRAEGPSGQNPGLGVTAGTATRHVLARTTTVWGPARAAGGARRGAPVSAGWVGNVPSWRARRHGLCSDPRAPAAYSDRRFPMRCNASSSRFFFTDNLSVSFIPKYNLMA